jgi:hypothetical protein
MPVKTSSRHNDFFASSENQTRHRVTDGGRRAVAAGVGRAGETAAITRADSLTCGEWFFSRQFGE